MFRDPYQELQCCQSPGALEDPGEVWLSSQIHGMVGQFHDSMPARVLDNGESTDAFPVTNGVQQGCVLAPTLFSMMFSAILSDAFCDDDETSIKIRFRTDGRLFNLCERGLSARLPNDCALNAAT